MINKDTVAAIEEIADTVDVAEYEDVKFLARDMAIAIEGNHTKDTLLWIMCLRLTAQILVDAQKNKTSVRKYLAKAGCMV